MTLGTTDADDLTDTPATNGASPAGPSEWLSAQAPSGGQGEQAARAMDNCLPVCLRWALLSALAALLLVLVARMLLLAENPWSRDPSEGYHKIAQFLAEGRLQEANTQTMLVALDAAGRGGEGWFDAESIETFPCPALSHLDRLWSTYSEGRFGFKAQHSIYKQQADARPDASDSDRYLAFAETVGWIDDGEPVSADALFRNLDQAPPGHLPLKVPPRAYRPTSPKSRSGTPETVYRLHQLMERIEVCLPD